MTVGEKQLLSITLLPQTVTFQTITYSSDNESVATINAMGRITAISIGKSNISVSCGNITRAFALTVKEAGSPFLTLAISQSSSDNLKYNATELLFLIKMNSLPFVPTVQMLQQIVPCNLTLLLLAYPQRPLRGNIPRI